MKYKIISLLIALILIVIVWYGISSTFTPMKRFTVKPINSTDKAIARVLVKVNRRLYGIEGGRLRLDGFEYFTVEQPEFSHYTVEAYFQDGTKIISSPLPIEDGWFVYVYIEETEITQRIRAKQ